MQKRQNGNFFMKNFFYLLLLVFLLSSCVTIKYQYIVERFLEFDDIDFNHVKKINIVCSNKYFAKELERYIATFYRNRALQKPKIDIYIEYKNGLSHEMTFNIKEINYKIIEGWKEELREPEMKNDKYLVFHNNIKYWRAIDMSISAEILRYGEIDRRFDVSNDVIYSIEGENSIQKNYKKLEDSVAMNKTIISTEDFARKNLKDIKDNILFYGAIDKTFREFFGKRLQPISKELVNFKLGFNNMFFIAQDYLQKDKFDEALLIWEEIFANLENPSFSRGVAAYNIAMFKTLVRDYESAAIYFNWSEELEREGLQELEKF